MGQNQNWELWRITAEVGIKKTLVSAEVGIFQVFSLPLFHVYAQGSFKLCATFPSLTKRVFYVFSRTYKLGITMPAVHLFLGYVCVFSDIYHHAKTDTDHIMKSEKPTMLKFSTKNKIKTAQAVC